MQRLPRHDLPWNKANGRNSSPAWDRNDLLRIAENTVKALLSEDEKTVSVLMALCVDYSFPVEAFERLRSQGRRMTDSAMAIFKSLALAASSPGTHTEAMDDQSLEHRQIVEDYDKILKAALKSVPDLAGFTGALERAMRQAIGGGSVSTTLFVGEVLENVSVAGNKAWASRRFSQGSTQDIGFVKRKGLWYIRLMARRPKGPVAGK